LPSASAAWTLPQFLSARRAAGRIHRALEIAATVGKPVFLHQRDSHQDFKAILQEFRGSLVGGVAPLFSPVTRTSSRDYLAFGFVLGVTGWICDERRGCPLREGRAAHSAHRMMLETDAPYLLPRDLLPRPGLDATSLKNLPISQSRRGGAFKMNHGRAWPRRPRNRHQASLT